MARATPPDSDVPYSRSKVTQIAVIDDGHGMSPTVLRRALKFGDGTRRDRTQRGIGRFGVGLPQSSISQCKRVDVWTWANGADNALHCYLDLHEINEDGVQVVPKPDPLPLPDQWRSISHNAGAPSGTLVVWSELDRVRWSGGSKTLERTGELCGRIYRKFIVDEQQPVQIDTVLASLRPSTSDLLVEQERRTCLPNDPLYLMAPSATPPPFDDRPMFKEFNKRTWTIKVNGEVGEICVRCSMATVEAINEKKSSIVWPRSYAKAGEAPWGKHANRNKGVSIVRARRELEMSLAWVNNYEPEERWWSVEVEFDPILDEIFGVVNNKQHAHAFVDGAGFDEGEVLEPGESFGDYRERLKNTGKLRYHLLDVWIWIDDQIKRMRNERRKLMRGTGTSRSHPDTGVQLEDSATDVINDQAEKGEIGESDKAPPATPEEKQRNIVRSATQRRVPQETAEEWAYETVSKGRRVLLKAVDLGHRDAFFGVESVNDIIEIWLNDRHPVHKHLIEVLTSDGDEEEQDPEVLAARLRDAAFSLEMLLVAWARHEDKAPANLRETMGDLRMDWGREARKFLEVIES
ncbi:MAG: ATP-binding protein [Gammaproteobacteria bacterium]|nr:ATP-binding protein [Gammaproteobacteria bacterium]